MRNDLWFKRAVFYQIYPRSFCDSNGDGIGDLKGITSKLEYLKELGVDCIWLSPCYKSPNDDIGYDISDYYSIQEEYGTMEDFDVMLDKIHSLGMKLIMDLVVNHTSTSHSWFQKSLEKDSPYRNYYYWKKGKSEKKPPNNWDSCFQGSAWEKDENTSEYYLHLFDKNQADLNWENEKVREEVLNILTFWFDKGIDGFRCDVINYISKPIGLPDDPKKLSVTKGTDQFTNGPKIHEYINFLNESSFSPREKLFLGETPNISTSDALDFTKRDRHEMDIVFGFEHVLCTFILRYIPTKFNIRKLKRVLSKWQNDLSAEGWNSLFLENHDQPRSVSIYGDDKEFRVESAKALISILALLKGSLFIYEGQEIGMTNYPFNDISELIDTASAGVFNLATKKLLMPKKTVFNFLNKTARDHSRTPMQWNDSTSGGFSTSTKTWMPVNPNYIDVNVEKSKKDENSILNYYIDILKFRKSMDVVFDGTYIEYLKNSKKFYVFERKNNDKTMLVVINHDKKQNNLKNLNLDCGDYAFGNYGKSDLYSPYNPYEVRVFVK